MRIRLALALLITALLHPVLFALSVSRTLRGVLLIPPVHDKEEIKFEENSTRVEENKIDCLCSPSQRGYRDDIRAFLIEGLNRIMKAAVEARSGTPEDIRFAEGNATGLVLMECVSFHNSSWEDCVNADASLRNDFPIQYCRYDIKTSKNINEFRESGKLQLKTVGSCDESPNGRSLTLGAKTDMPSASMNEGCIAVEHLRGYVLQHPRNLRRPVLCARGFCATPNHAILVRGELTSMNKMCSSGRWKCVETVKMVNNLKISSNRRARISEDIVGTPYDIRFPKAFCWVAQILEDILYIVSTSVVLGFFSVTIALMRRKVT